MRILAFITARGGSKRVPGKNIRPLGGKPLIVWSIDVAAATRDVVDILVSTDDEKVGEVARRAGALVPWLRPAYLANDTASSVPVCLHGLDWYECEKGKVDGLLLLQPTSPFRTRATVERGIAEFSTSGHRPVIGVSAAESHPMRAFTIEGSRMHPFVEGGGLHLRSQDLPPAYIVNGAFYLVSPAHLRARESFYSEDMRPLIMEDQDEALDIDTERDWRKAESYLAAGRGAADARSTWQK